MDFSYVKEAKERAEMRAAEDHIDVTYGGENFQGTRDEVILQLRERFHLSVREIGELTGCSRTTAGKVLRNGGVIRKTDHAKVLKENRVLFDIKSVDEIVEQTGVPRYEVERYRRSLVKSGQIQRHRSPDLVKRRMFFVGYLFGPGYKPGPKFPEFVSMGAKQLTERQGEVLVDFYVTGELDTKAAPRIYRTSARGNFKAMVSSLDVMELVAQEVLIVA